MQKVEQASSSPRHKSSLADSGEDYSQIDITGRAAGKIDYYGGNVPPHRHIIRHENDSMTDDDLQPVISSVEEQEIIQPRKP